MEKEDTGEVKHSHNWPALESPGGLVKIELSGTHPAPSGEKHPSPVRKLLATDRKWTSLENHWVIGSRAKYMFLALTLYLHFWEIILTTEKTLCAEIFISPCL